VGGGLTSGTIGATQIEAVAVAAKLGNLLRFAPVQAWELDPHLLALVTQMRQSLHLVPICLAYNSINVLGAVINLVLCIVVLSKRNGGGRGTPTSGRMMDICNKIALQMPPILCAWMRYPSDRSPECKDEEEAKEYVFRTSLRKVYQRFASLRPRVTLSYMCVCLGNLLAPLSSRCHCCRSNFSSCCALCSTTPRAGVWHPEQGQCWGTVDSETLSRRCNRTMCPLIRTGWSSSSTLTWL
jgi:hypothetical protein